MASTRILLYPEGADEEIEFADGACSVPAVGDHVQVIDKSEGRYEHTPWYEVVRRKWYSTRYGHDSFEVEVALTVRKVEDSP